MAVTTLRVVPARRAEQRQPLVDASEQHGPTTHLGCVPARGPRDIGGDGRAGVG